MSNQLIKTTELGKENIFPRTRILDLFDDTSGLKLIDILNSFNMMFVPYLGNKSYTRNQISPELRRQGLWLTYVIDNTVYTEWYDEVAIDDTNWGSDSNWRQGSNALVGDLSISPNGTWVINGEDSGITIKGDKGDSPVIRIYDNKILVSYDKGITYEDLNNTPVYTKFRFNSLTNTYLVSYDLGTNWQDISDEKVYHKFRYNNTTNTYLESIDFGKTWSNISAEKVYTKFRFNRSTNTYQISTDLGLNWTDVSSDKVYYQFRYNRETNTHLVSTDFGTTWTNVSEDKVFYLFRTNNNRLLVSTDLGTTWENCSEPIAAWFRWAGGDTANSVGKIQISRDNSTWEDLSPNIVNNLRIKGYVSTISNLPSSAALGDIYMVGPTYDESDTTHDYPHYRMWVKQSSGWVDNGEYLSNVLISLTTGLETGITMSLKAITDTIADETARAKVAEQGKLNITESPIKNVKESGIYFTDKQGNAFMIYSNEKGLDVSKISQEMANKVLTFLTIEQGLGDSPTNPISQKAVTEAITDVENITEVAEDGAFLTNEKGEVFARFVDGKFEAAGIASTDDIEKLKNNIKDEIPVKDTEEDGAFLTNEKGEVFARFVDGKFEAAGMEFPDTHVENLEDIKNVTGGSSGQFLQKQSNGKWAGAGISFPQPILSGLTDVDVNPVEGSILQYRSGKWVNAEISTEGLITTDSRVNHPMYGKHFFVFGDSHTEAPNFGLWQMLCEFTGAIYHTLLRKTVSDGTQHYFSATTSTTNYGELIDEEDTGIEVNCDGLNWSQYAHAAYTYAQSKGFNIDYILVENCHFGKWEFYNEDGSLKENVPIILLNKTKVYSKIFENASAVSSFISKDENVAKVVDELGFDSIDASFNLRYGTASQTLTFSFSEGETLNTDCVAKIYFGEDSSNFISTDLTQGMTLSGCVDAINQWAFDEYSTWTNPTKGSQGNTEILLNYSSTVGGDSSSIAKLEVTNGANLTMQQPTISVQATSWIHQYGLKDTSGLRKSSSWLRSGGSVNWSLPNAMLGAMQYMGKYSPKTKFVFLGIWNNSMQEDYIYEDGSVNPYNLMKSSSYKNGQISKKSIKDIAELFGWQYIDVDKLCGITPFNVTPTFNDYNNVHMKRDGYKVSAECIAKYIK